MGFLFIWTPKVSVRCNFDCIQMNDSKRIKQAKHWRKPELSLVLHEVPVDVFLTFWWLFFFWLSQLCSVRVSGNALAHYSLFPAAPSRATWLQEERSVLHVQRRQFPGWCENTSAFTKFMSRSRVPDVQLAHKQLFLNTWFCPSDFSGRLRIVMEEQDLQ